MDNKQEQNIDIDELLGATQEDTKLDFGDSKDADLDSFMEDEPIMEFSPLVNEKSYDEEDVVDEKDNPEPVADFNDFKLEDLDSALKSFQEARRGKVSTLKKSEPKVDENKSEDKIDENLSDDISVEVPEAENVFEQPPVGVETEENTDYSAADEDISANFVDDGTEDESYSNQNDTVSENMENDEIDIEDDAVDYDETKKNRVNINPMVIEDKDLALQGISEKSEEILRWYSGKLDDKTYELSIDNMPEFLDTDKTIRVIHVSVASPYGWNVFFDNGIFMNLQDLQIYQTRHGKMPYSSGKIVYGNKTTQFENINRIVVYELPRYFSYKPE